MDGNKFPWMDQGVLNLLGPLHDFPQHLETLLSKFDPHISTSTEDHIQNL